MQQKKYSSVFSGEDHSPHWHTPSLSPTLPPLHLCGVCLHKSKHPLVSLFNLAPLLNGAKNYFFEMNCRAFYFVCRNATLELTADNRIRSSNSKHSNVRHTAFNSLALSVEQDGQALSEVSSFAESLHSQPGELQVSVASHTSAAGVGFIKYYDSVWDFHIKHKADIHFNYALLIN